MATSFSTAISRTDATLGKVSQHTTSFATAGDYVQTERLLITEAGEITIAINSAITGGNGPGWLIVKNHDATNFLKVGTVTTVYWAEADPGDGTETMMVPIARGATNIYARADTADVDATFEIYER